MCLVAIQKSLSTRPLALKGAESALKEKCNKSKKEILVCELRKHLKMQTQESSLWNHMR